MILKKLLAISLSLLLLFSFAFSYKATPVHATSPTIETYTATGALSGPGTSVSIDLPTGVSSGDLLVACVAAAGSDTSDMSATGWTHVITAGGGGTSPKIGFLYRFWQSGDSDPAVFTVGSTAMALRRGVIWRISGADASPSDTTASSNVVSTSQTSRIYTGITTNTDDALLLGCMNWVSNDSTYTKDGSLTNTVTQNRNAADYGVQASAGSTGDFTGSGNASPYVSILWAVKPGTSNTAPTIAINGPSNGATGVSTTPTLSFTGSDTENDNLSYEIEVTDNPDSFTGGSVLEDNFSGGSGGSFHPQPYPTQTTWQGNIQVDDRMCQSFTAAGGKWSKATLNLTDSRVDTDGTAYARIYEHTGTYGTSSAIANAGSPADQTASGTPTKNWLAESDGVALGASFSSGDVDFTASGDNQIRLTAGTHYVLCGDWVPNNNLANNTFAWTGDVLNSGTLHAGNMYNDGYSDTNNGIDADWDLHFSVYETFSLESSNSTSDSGFTNSVNGGDTTPFTAGDQINYSVQSTLDDGITYYWRVRANDGTANSSWSSTQSFTTSASSTPTPTPTSTPNSSTTSSGSAPAVCSDTSPGSIAPYIYKSEAVGPNSIKLSFNPGSGPFDKYALVYGLESGTYKFGAVNLGNSSTTSILVDNLLPSTNYYFKLRQDNGCATGNFSNEVNVATTSLGGSQNSTISTDENTAIVNSGNVNSDGQNIGTPQASPHPSSILSSFWQTIVNFFKQIFNIK